jgi:hypothetical protein
MGEELKMDLREIGWRNVEWVHLVQDRVRWRAVVNAVMNIRVLAPRSYLVYLDGLLTYFVATVAANEYSA